MLLPYRFRRLGPALKAEPLPVVALALSAIVHVMALAVLAILAGIWSQWNQSKVYVVNLVPAVAAIGTAPARIPQVPALPPRPTTPEPPSSAPESTAPEPKTRPTLPETSLPQARSPTRPPALPRPGEKESPSLASAADRPDRRPPQPSRESKPEPPAAAAPRAAVAPIPLGRPGGSPAGTASLSLDVSDFPFTYYLRQLQQKVSEKWVPPAREAEPGNRVVVLFEIGRDGQVRATKIERSSGNAVYDQSALRAIMDANPFPPLPQEFPAHSLRVHFGFEFKRG
jgi:protein TonB